MFWWYDPSLQRVTNTRAFTSNIVNRGYFEIWPMMLPEWVTRVRLFGSRPFDMAEIERLEMELDPRVVKAATEAGLDPNRVDYHLEGIHGWESHDIGYIEVGLPGTITCLLRGGCTEHGR